MNKEPGREHPAEEELMEFALQNGKKELESHINSCAACTETVKEFREVGRQVVSLSDEEVPERVEQRVLKLTRHGPIHGHQGPERPKGFGLGSLFSNPVFMTLLILLLLLVLYFLVGSEVFKAQ